MEPFPFSQEGPLSQEHPGRDRPDRPDPVPAPATVARLHAMLTAVPLPEVDDGTWRRLVSTALARLGTEGPTDPTGQTRQTGPTDQTRQTGPIGATRPPHRPDQKDTR
ncbi:hypothetical protein AB0I39_18440 [Kitasatospora purpeofusca]|uniref:hypothetical protein n=1 Tax=Kitasatospora purpeofusca TaxID=67352 RepID=UPI0033CF72BC